jgi:hypothetical protein
MGRSLHCLKLQTQIGMGVGSRMGGEPGEVSKQLAGVALIRMASVLLPLDLVH